jgi:hypothetical protein
MEFIVGIVLGLLFKSLNEYTQVLRISDRKTLANFLEGVYLLVTLGIFSYFYL